MAQDSPPATAPAATAAPAAPADEDEIVVTATKRSENLQDVPIAITAFSTKTLDDLQVDSFDDYAKLVPSLSFKSSGPGSANVYFRGVASGENANHSASLPSVGTYLDEQPITTIQGALDLHVFDIARSRLAGPQARFTARRARPAPSHHHQQARFSGSTGGKPRSKQGRAWRLRFYRRRLRQLPISTNVAARVVGWYRRDAGYIDNIAAACTSRPRYHLRQ